MGVALGLAALAGSWLGRRFTKPLTQLAKGADAFQAGNFDYRIPAKGNNEFAAVAIAMNEMGRQVSEQISRLENDAHRRRQFLADVAHELRSPVTTMETMAGALKDGLAEDPQRRDFAVSALVDTSQRLRRLVQDLMELARFDLAQLPLNLAEVDLRELVSMAIQSHEVEAAAAGVVLHPLDFTQPVMAVADPDRIVQVLNNILENAISYAGEGAEVNVTLEDGDQALISIADTGKGISAEEVPFLTDPFYRADSARSPNDSHSGLGLSIANKLVEAHGGKLTISAREGVGTVVTIIIPKSSGR
jgi:two-component system sensor histidine kinase BaeS